MAIKKENVAMAGDERFPLEHKEMSIRLPKTKTGPNQFVIVRDITIQRLFRELVNNTKKGEKVFPFSSNQYRGVFKKVCAQLSLSDRSVPHSLRHGGATHLHLAEKMKVEDIMVLGRWAALKSAKRYIQAGRALLMTVDIPADVGKLASVFANDILLSLSSAKKRFASSK